MRPKCSFNSEAVSYRDEKLNIIAQEYDFITLPDGIALYVDRDDIIVLEGYWAEKNNNWQSMFIILGAENTSVSFLSSRIEKEKPIWRRMLDFVLLEDSFAKYIFGFYDNHLFTYNSMNSALINSN